VWSIDVLQAPGSAARELVDLLECGALMFFKLLAVLPENWLIFYGCNLLDFLFL
jgi:hypothetical protein